MAVIQRQVISLVIRREAIGYAAGRSEESSNRRNLHGQRDRRNTVATDGKIPRGKTLAPTSTPFDRAMGGLGFASRALREAQIFHLGGSLAIFANYPRISYIRNVQLLIASRTIIRSTSSRAIKASPNISIECLHDKLNYLLSRGDKFARHGRDTCG